jgi:cytidyltransferase-like protein
LHDGHKALLRKAFASGEKVVIGVATGNLLKNKSRKEMIYPYERRVEDIKEFLASEGCLQRSEIVPISEPFGPAATDPEMEAIVVGEETQVTVKDINEARGRRNLPPLQQLVVKTVRDKTGKPIKSSGIREKEARTQDSH